LTVFDKSLDIKIKTISNKSISKQRGEDYMAKTTVRPGEKVPQSGQYKTPGMKETTLVKGATAPPTPKPGQVHTLVDKTKHKND
jgi:hypothetical protein